MGANLQEWVARWMGPSIQKWLCKNNVVKMFTSLQLPDSGGQRYQKDSL
jgi:hypothetical protein